MHVYISLLRSTSQCSVGCDSDLNLTYRLISLLQITGKFFVMNLFLLTMETYPKFEL